MEKKAALLGSTYEVLIEDKERNTVYKTDDGFEYYYDSHWWFCFFGLAAFFIIFIVAAIGIIPLSYSAGWWSETVFYWQNIAIFLIGVPLLIAVISGYFGSKYPTYNSVGWGDIRRWDLYKDKENLLAIFYGDADSISVKSFNAESDHLAAEIATELSTSLGSDKLTLIVSGVTLLDIDGKKYCEYCGDANPDSELKCQKCGASL
jgi:hypothetical protein